MIIKKAVIFSVMLLAASTGIDVIHSEAIGSFAKESGVLMQVWGVLAFSVWIKWCEK